MIAPAKVPAKRHIQQFFIDGFSKEVTARKFQTRIIGVLQFLSYGKEQIPFDNTLFNKKFVCMFKVMLQFVFDVISAVITRPQCCIISVFNNVISRKT